MKKKPTTYSVPNQYEYDIIVYGMPIYRIEEMPYMGLFGNATRAFGLANNFSKMGFRTALVVQKGFSAQPSPYLCSSLQFIEESQLPQIAKTSKNLVLTFTHFASSHLYGINPFIEHPEKFCVCCFEQNGSFDFRTLMDEIYGITFNNIIQKQMWDDKCTQIPSHVVSFGIDEFDYVDEAIKPVHKSAAIWIGEIRRQDVLERIVNFALANPNCPVDVVTRKIFDHQLPPDSYGGINFPYADFKKCGGAKLFHDVVEQLLGRKQPSNLRYLGMMEGQNHVILGTYTIGLDFSRFPNQLHDNTKVIDYLRSGLAVICDDGAPSYRYVNEFQHGCVLPSKHSKDDLQKAFLLCENITSYANRRRVAQQVKSRYGWDKIAANIAIIMNEDEKCHNLIEKKRKEYRLLSPAFKLLQMLSKASRKLGIHNSR